MHMTTLEGVSPPTRSTSRPSVSYQQFVFDYAAMQRRNVLAVFVGIALIAGAGIRLHSWPMVIIIAVGLGIAAAGAVGFTIAAAAHSDYARRLGVSTSTTYAQPETAPTVRPFVASRNGSSGGVIRRGRFALTTTQWVKLYEAARRNDGRLTRDAIVAARLPRTLYGDGAWGNTLADLARVGLVDAAGVITPEGWSFYETEIAPLPPNGETANRSDIVRPTRSDRGDRRGVTTP